LTGRSHSQRWWSAKVEVQRRKSQSLHQRRGQPQNTSKCRLVTKISQLLPIRPQRAQRKDWRRWKHSANRKRKCHLIHLCLRTTILRWECSLTTFTKKTISLLIAHSSWIMSIWAIDRLRETILFDQKTNSLSSTIFAQAS